MCFCLSTNGMIYNHHLPTVVTRAWLNGLPVNERIIDVFPTPVSPSNSTLYVTSYLSSIGDDDFPDDILDDIRDDVRGDDVAVDDDDDDDIRDI